MIGLDAKVVPRGRIVLYGVDSVFPVVPVLIILAAWALAAWFINVSVGVYFPGPWDTFALLFQLMGGRPLFRSTLYAHLFASLGRFLLGLVSATVVGVSAGLVMGYSKSVREHLYPVVSILQPIPSVTWIPVAIMLFGIGNLSTVLIIFMAAIWPTVVNTVAGAESVPDNYKRMAGMFRLRRSGVFARIVVPHSVPYILNGLRISVANAWRALVAAEMIAATGTGLGYVIIQSRWNLDYTSAFACIVVIAVIGYVMERIVFRRLEYVTLKRWGMLAA